MRTYTTVQGDMWDKIAYEQLGSEEYTDSLMNANAAYCNIYVFSSGIELVIPDVENISSNSSLPPWKQVM